MRVLGGRYELGQAVGRGGMGAVWRSVDRELGRTVAVKVLPAELTRQQEFRDRFRREARTVAALSHPGVATLYDVGEDLTGDEPTPFLVMEFVDGRTLAEALQEGPLPIGRTVAIARDVADALGAGLAAAVALLWSARLAVLLVWGPLAGLVSAPFAPSSHRVHRHQAFSAFGDADGWTASDLKSQEFAAIAPFILLAVLFLVAFLRRRDAPGLYIAAFWLFATLIGWSCRSVGNGTNVIGLGVALGLLAVVVLAQEVQARSVPAAAPTQIPHGTTQPA
ncbi:protein kinase domain-containing protein [Embleya sp. NBC_00896]|uniref:protein kinase domain-containing protein n=1 Tax=Embleya sp. NBC_00896 TaxID=2975961 RepID=UPI0038686AFC|nr:protein kinase [Embleya sp. NBC_00896]